MCAVAKLRIVAINFPRLREKLQNRSLTAVEVMEAFIAKAVEVNGQHIHASYKKGNIPPYVDMRPRCLSARLESEVVFDD